MRRGSPWNDEDLGCARFMRHCGMSDADIGRELGRSAASVAGKLGYIAKQQTYCVNAGLYESARPAAARKLGQLADDYECRGTA